MNPSPEHDTLRKELLDVCRNLGDLINRAQRGLAADPSFVNTSAYGDLRAQIRHESARLQELKSRRKASQHWYSVIIEGDVLKDGKILKNFPLSCELSSVIDCQLGDSTSLSRNKGTHKALWNLLKSKFGAIFLENKFRMGYIVQLR